MYIIHLVSLNSSEKYVFVGENVNSCCFAYDKLNFESELWFMATNNIVIKPLKSNATDKSLSYVILTDTDTLSIELLISHTPVILIHCV